jgi:hypothetical protein
MAFKPYSPRIPAEDSIPLHHVGGSRDGKIGDVHRGDGLRGEGEIEETVAR